MLRYIKIGDIFCFKFDDHTYYFGRIIAMRVFHIAEIFNHISDQPIIQEGEILHADRLVVIPLDTYCLFDRKTEGEWRIIGHQEDYTPEHMEDIYFSLGGYPLYKKTNIFEHTIPISGDEWKALPALSPNRDFRVKKIIEDKLKEKME